MATNTNTRSFLTFVAVMGAEGRVLGFRHDGTLVKANGNPVSEQLARDTVTALLDGSVKAISVHRAGGFGRRHGKGATGEWVIRGLDRSARLMDFTDFVTVNAAAKGRTKREARTLLATIRQRYS